MHPSIDVSVSPKTQRIRDWVRSLLRVARWDVSGNTIETDLEIIKMETDRADAAECLMAQCSGGDVPTILAAAGLPGRRSDAGLRLLTLLLLAISPDNPKPVLRDFARGEASPVSTAVIGRLGEQAVPTLVEMLGASRDQAICGACGLLALAKAGVSRGALRVAVGPLHAALWAGDARDDELADHLVSALWAIGAGASREFLQGKAVLAG